MVTVAGVNVDADLDEFSDDELCEELESRGNSYWHRSIFPERNLGE
jgi:hypothetical protein